MGKFRFSQLLFLLGSSWFCQFVWGSQANDYVPDQSPVPEKIFNQLQYSDINSDPNLAQLQFQPIRIHIYEANWKSLTSMETSRLREVLHLSVEKVSSLLSVRPVEGNLRLERKKACKWRIKKRCVIISPSYKNEFCIAKVDNFMIPDEHLAGVDVFQSGATLKPSNVSIKPGSGIPNSDFVLYVAVRQSDICQAQDVIAYSSYCQLGKNDIPVAGFANFCPKYLKNDNFSLKKNILATIHELFHVLGFSSDLFPYFKQCDPLGNCYNQKVFVGDNGKYKIMLPTVIYQMQKHFGCDDPDFGALLDISKTKLPSSHWDPLIFHYSIMAPRITDPDLTSIDPITLSLFESTGWYKVNYSNTDQYLWGKDSGCNLNKFSDCSYPYLCIPNKEMKGCNFAHTAVSKCQLISPLYTCGVYSEPIETCSGNISTCFFLETNSTENGECLHWRCSDTRLDIKVGTQWLECPLNSQLDIQFLPGYETIYCQRSTNICQNRVNFPTYLALKSEVPEDQHFKIWYQIKSPTPEQVKESHDQNLEEFREAATRRIADSVRVTHAWINSSKLYESDSQYWILIDFAQPNKNIITEEEKFEMLVHIDRLAARGNVTIDLHDLVYVSALESHKGITSNEEIKGLMAIWIIIGLIVISALLSGIGISLLERKRHARNISHANVGSRFKPSNN